MIYHNNMKLKNIPYIFIIIFSLLLYGATLRGNFGVPSAYEIDNKLSSSGEAFETSQERSRYAIILALTKNHKFDLGEFASMGTPDIGVIKGKFYSFFPPATSLLALPFYLLGLKLGATQLLTFIVPTIFALMTGVLIYKTVKELGGHWSVGIFASVAFAFATNAWGYSITLYAHLLSSFFILMGIYFASISKKENTIMASLIVWLCYAAAIFVDFPNIFIFFPIALFTSLKLFDIKTGIDKLKVKLRLFQIFTPIIFLLFMGLYGYYNYVHFDSPLKFSNTLARVRDLKVVSLSSPETGSDSVGALEPRSLVNGLYSFTISHDRGVVWYSPVILLFVFGVGSLRKSRKNSLMLLLAIPSVCLVLYSMFGDPYGGWSFGSRYMVAIMPELCILAGIGLQQFYKNYLVRIVYSVVFIYSSLVSALSPLTTNVIPPYVEARHLGLDSTYFINIKMLLSNQLNSFLFNNFFHKFINGITYYSFVVSLVIVCGFILIWIPQKSNDSIV